MLVSFIQKINQKNHLTFKVIFLFLITSVCFTRSEWFIDDNLLLRYTLASFWLLLLVITQRNLRFGILEFLLLGIFFLSLLSMLWSMSASEALFDAHRFFLGLPVFVTIIKLLELGERPFIMKLLISLALALIIYNAGLLGLTFLHDKPFAGSSAHPNLLASLMYLLIPLLIYAQHYINKSWKKLAWITMALCITVIMLLSTRSALLGLLVFIAGFAIYRIWGNWSRKVVIGGMIGIALLICSIPLAVSSGLFDSTSLYERLFIWEKTWRLIQEAPFYGVGAGNWALNYTKFGIGGFDTFEVFGLRMQRPHNDFLWITAELGLLGLFLYTLFLGYLTRSWLKLKRSPATVLLIGVLGYMVIASFSFPRERIEHQVLLFIVFAIVAFESDYLPKVSRWMKWVFILPLVLGVLIGAYRLNGEYHAREMITAKKSSDHQNTIELAQAAQSPFYNYVGGDVPISSFMAEAHLRLTNHDAFEFYSKKAYEEAPFNYEVVSNYGMSLNAQQRYDEARSVLLDAHAINPRFDGALLNLAIVHYNLQRYSEAEEWLDRVNFKSPMTDYYAGLIHKKLEERGGDR